MMRFAKNSWVRNVAKRGLMTGSPTGIGMAAVLSGKYEVVDH
eukprot:CAMPEP_0173356820 /NCGR_PEP_ID=MMETSP1144-20121109/18535_1 /TAXON_ID=483371 /ORGANISM="non described non described, Strain CCMP2298" /LENGTH=41 /DNA_ID= /DNA_START= /DNA_END= /DNA_ORIENTATION=